LCTVAASTGVGTATAVVTDFVAPAAAIMEPLSRVEDFMAATDSRVAVVDSMAAGVVAAVTGKPQLC